MTDRAPMAHGPGGWVGDSPGVGWSWRPEILLPLSVLLALYGVGWWRLRSQSRLLVPIWRLLSWFAGIGAVGVALLSPVAGLADDLFFVHMVQHLLVIKVAAPAVLLADPLRLWHLPAAYEAALTHRLLHDAEHLAFFGAGLLFWWPVIAPAPHLRPRVHHGARIVYLVLATFQEAALGLVLTVVPWVLYPSYSLAPRVLALTAQQDQTWGGIVMWGAGGAIDMLVVLALLFRLLGRQELPALGGRPEAQAPVPGR